MTTTEKLERIKSKCQQLLENSVDQPMAEAGWRATIAAIDDSIRQPVPEGWCHPDNPVFCENTPLINNILAAWPEELL